MRIRFLQTTASSVPEFPFQAGQIIDVPRLTAEHKRWLAQGVIVRLDPEPAEAATLDAPEQTANLESPKPRGKR